MPLSPAELSYLRSSLELSSPVRPDSRLVNQFRPLQAASNFLPSTNGSARVKTADGAECIVGVKAKVIQLNVGENTENFPVEKLVSVDVDISGLRDDSPGLTLICSTLQEMLVNSQLLSGLRLKLSSRFAFKLFIDALVLSHASNPLNLLSLTIYLALMSTRLPKLVSSIDDSAAEEIPVFDDDWDHSIPLTSDRHGDVEMIYKPPLLFVFAVVGNNLLVDPSRDEEIVSEGGVLVGWENGKVAAPIRFVELGNSPEKGVKPAIISKAFQLALEAGGDVAESLDLISKLDREDELEFGPPSMF